MMTLWHLPEVAGKNPYGQLLMRSLEERGVKVVPVAYRHLFALRALADRPDVVHFQFIDVFVLPAGPSPSWWRALIKGPLFLLQVGLLRLAGCRIVWTVHDLLNHERRFATVEWCFSLLFTRLAHGLVVHCEVARHEVIRLYRLRGREEKVSVLFHPNYVGAYPTHVTREQARLRLGIEPAVIVILCLGQIRRYKGLPEVVQAFGALPRQTRAELWIAGEPVDQALASELAQAAKDAPGVHLRVGYLQPGEVDELLRACDVVALPYLRILTSGAAALAMSYGKPCVAPRLGCLVEVLDDKGAFLYDATAPDGLSRALARAVESSGDLAAMGDYNFARASACSWPKAAGLLIDLYRGMLDAGAASAAGSGGK